MFAVSGVQHIFKLKLLQVILLPSANSVLVLPLGIGQALFLRPTPMGNKWFVGKKSKSRQHDIVVAVCVVVRSSTGRFERFKGGAILVRCMGRVCGVAVAVAVAVPGVSGQLIF